ncbi:MAG: stage II sporulation protein P [Firmicutes bacterium]|nr:stage II sporulation protein P [Bacillota bacterium]
MRKGLGTAILGVYLLSTVFFYDQMPAARGEEKEGLFSTMKITAEDFGVMCISAAYPGITTELTDSRDNEKQDGADDGTVTLSGNSNSAQIITSDYEKAPEPVVFGDNPAVLIVHTHATESYLPASEGNYHTTERENTVRDVGQVLAETLKANGIAAVHDQTLHDNPSYSQSYSRSYETISSLLKKYPTVRCVIDLHRDAIASDGPAATVSAGGKNCAKYSFVVSNAVETYKANKKFIGHLNETASEKYKGFTGTILERGYRYNQNLSEKYLLLEIGYNRNHITEARNTAEVFGQILADTLKAGY